MMKTAQTIWTTKIVPAILDYGDSCSKGKAAIAVREARCGSLWSSGSLNHSNI